MKLKSILVGLFFGTGLMVNAQNLITDGSFPSTATTFSTNLSQECVYLNLIGSEYCVNSQGWNGSDHSTPSDNTMKINSFHNTSVSPLIWGKTVAVPAGKAYKLSFWTQNRNAANSTHISIYIDGVFAEQVSYSGSGWAEHSYSFTCNSTSVLIELKQTHIGNFYDFDLDDLSLVETNDWPLEVISGSGADTRSTFCAGKNIVSTFENIYTAGDFMGEIFLDGQSHTNNSGNWLPWLAQYDNNKQLDWVANITGTSNAPSTEEDQGGVTGIDVDNEGAVYITGFFKNATIDFDGIAITNYSSTHWSSYVAKFRSDGDIYWVKHIEDVSPQNPGSMNQTLGGVKVDDNGDFVYVTGNLLGHLSNPFQMIFPPNTYTDYVTGQQRGFITKLNASNGSNLGVDVSFDCPIPRDFEITSTTAYVGGHTAGATSVGYLPFIAEIDLSTLSWNNWNVGYTATTQRGNVLGLSVALYEDRVFLAGHGIDPDNVCFNGYCSAGLSGDYVAWVASFSSSLACDAIASITGPGRMEVYDIVVDGESSIYVAGTTGLLSRFRNKSGVIQITKALTSGSAISDLFVAKYDQSLSTVNWAKRFGGNYTSTFTASLDYNTSIDGVYASANFIGGAMDIGPRNITNGGSGHNYFMGRLTESNGTSFKKGDQTTSIADRSTSEVVLYPNPADEQLVLVIDDKNEGSVFTLHNTLGQPVIISSALNSGEHLLDISALTPGAYFFTLKGQNEEIKTGRVVVQ